MHLLFSIFVLSLLQDALGHPLDCNTWRSSCDRYQSQCLENLENRPLKSCCEPLQSSNLQELSEFQSGHYTLQSGMYSTSDAWCDMETDGGGWLVVMRRLSNEFTFNRLYSEYEDGFGSLDGDFWYGLRSMEALTSRESYEMRVDMYNNTNDNESASHALYSSFEVGGTNYTLSLGEFTGSDPNLMNNLEQFNNMRFSAKHTVLDASNSCANVFKGGWWYAVHCVADDAQTPGSILTQTFRELDWYDINLQPGAGVKQARVFSKYEMKIRPKDCLTVDNNTSH